MPTIWQEELSENHPSIKELAHTVPNGNAFGCDYSPLECMAEKVWVGGEIPKRLGTTSGTIVHL